MNGRRAAERSWDQRVRSGYCYHSAARSYKTETLVRKWREGWGNPKQRAMLAWELSFRDPALALSEVKARIADPAFARQRKTLRLCLHHVADAETARELFRGEDFDPDALHLNAYTALLDDVRAALPGLSPVEAEGRLRKLGFLEGPVANPIVDGPGGTEAARSSPVRYEESLVHFLTGIYDEPAVAHVRGELSEHLRRTYRPDAYVFLLRRWASGQLHPVEAIAGVSRLGWDVACTVLGEPTLTRLVHHTIESLAEAPIRFEASALDNGWFPAALADLPAPLAIAMGRAFLGTERHESSWEPVGRAMLKLGAPGAREVLATAPRHAPSMVCSAASMLPYAEAAALLAPHGLAEHGALTEHPAAPPDLSLVARAESLVAEAPQRAVELLAKVARSERHPHRARAFEALVALGRRGQGDTVRRHALHRLGEVGDPRATPVLLDALGDPSMAGSRSLVTTALALAGDRTALPALGALADQDHGSGAAEAITAIEQRGT